MAGSSFELAVRDIEFRMLNPCGRREVGNGTLLDLALAVKGYAKAQPHSERDPRQPEALAR